MSNRSWMPLNIPDYLKDTRHLTTLEHGAYLLLIMRYWEDGGLPDNETLISRYAGLTPDQWAESREMIAAFFDDGWKHKRIDAELARAAEVMEKRRASGKLGGTKRQASARQVPSKTQHTDTDIDKDTSSLRSDVSARPTKRSRRLGEDEALPDDWRADAEAEGLPPAQHDLEWRKMRNWSLSSPKGAKANWRAMWRNWAQKAATDLPRAGPATGRVPIRNSANKLAQEMVQSDAKLRSNESVGGVRQAIPNLSVVSGGNRG